MVYSIIPAQGLSPHYSQISLNHQIGIIFFCWLNFLCSKLETGDDYSFSQSWMTCIVSLPSKRLAYLVTLHYTVLENSRFFSDFWKFQTFYYIQRGQARIFKSNLNFPAIFSILFTNKFSAVNPLKNEVFKIAYFAKFMKFFFKVLNRRKLVGNLTVCVL